MTEERATGGMVLLPPAPERCQVCAGSHEPGDPHDPYSLYWQLAWAMEHGPGTAPTWDDALAHCDDATYAAWAAALVDYLIVLPPRGRVRTE